MGKYQDYINGNSETLGDDVPYYEDERGIRTDAAAEGIPISGAQFGISGTILMHEPRSPEDVENIIRSLRSHEFAIVQLSGDRPSASQRILDMLAGAVYALDGRMAVVNKEQNVYLLTPSGVSIQCPTKIQK